jgi:iron(III) transport system substrate-binding protein
VAKGQVTMPSPLASGAALIHAATLTGNLEGGWAHYEKLKENGAMAGGGNGDILKSVAGGRPALGDPKGRERSRVGHDRWCASC